MTQPHDSEQASEARADRIGDLVRLAGRRPVPDAARMSDARATARLEWTRVVERRPWRLASWWLTTAAVAMAVLGTIAWLGLRHPSVPAVRSEIATLEAVIGPLVVIDDRGESRTVTAAGARVRAGERIDTAAGTRAALRMPGGVSVRLDRNTSAVVDSESRLTLQHGAAYVDAEPGPGGAALQIATSLGVVRHTGTQFEARLDAALEVRVREGSVAVDAAGMRWTSQAGELLVLAQGRPPERRSIATSGPEWSWVSDVAPPFRLEGATVPAFLRWIAREHGWKLEFGDSALRARIERIVLHGSIVGLSAEEALAAVLPTCGLTSRRQADRLIVSAAQ